MKLITVFLLGYFVAGCSMTSPMQRQADQMNQALASQYAPTRVKFADHGGGATSLETGTWAGQPGRSVFHEQQKSAVFSLIKQSCGLVESDLLETRVVTHQAQFWYEVWVFENPSPDTQRKQKGVSVVVTYDPTSNRSQTTLYGCSQN